MDIYVYVDDTPILGDDAYIQIVLSLDGSICICEDGEELRVDDDCGKKRLNVSIKSGFDVKDFSPMIKEDLRICYNIMS